MSKSPTNDTYPRLQRAFDYFNEHLFNGRLSSPLFTLENNARSHGHFTKNKYHHRNGEDFTHEICLNPMDFAQYSIKTCLSYLVFQMCHQYQAEFGVQQPRRFYHDKEWAGYMEQRGLIPSQTGAPNGNKVGQSMKHYIQEDGPFDKLAGRFIKEGFNFNWHEPAPPRRRRLPTPDMTPSRRSAPPLNSGPAGAAPRAAAEMPEGQILAPEADEPKPRYNSSNRVKWMCGKCFQFTWGRHGLQILCGKDGCDSQPLFAVADY
jgi:hypothetical protein